MTNELVLQAVTRGKEEKMSQLKKDGFVPVSLYGPSSDCAVLKIKLADIRKAFLVFGESNLLDLSIDGKSTIKILFKNIDREVMKNQIIHADLYQVDMNKKITAEVPLRFVGESKAIKDFGGTLVKTINHIEIECLPAVLMDHLDIDLSVLNELGDSLYVKDLKLPAGSKIIGLHDEDMIVSAVETAAEAVVAEPVVAPAAVVAPAKTEKKK